MELSFITIHDLSLDANILWASDSVSDILGYTPGEIWGRPCFNYFYPNDVPIARSVYAHGVLLNCASNLHYGRLRSKDGSFRICECCFTVVDEVVIACSRIHRPGEKSYRRAVLAPHISHVFARSIRDVACMIGYSSPTPQKLFAVRTPRAGLLVDRFSRSLPIIFATSVARQLLGAQQGHVKPKSFYDHVHHDHLAGVVQWLENTKTHDSISYFHFRLAIPQNQDGMGNTELDGVDNEPCTAKMKGPKKSPAWSCGEGCGEAEQGLEVEAIASATSDGILMVMQGVCHVRDYSLVGTRVTVLKHAPQTHALVIKYIILIAATKQKTMMTTAMVMR